MKMLCNWINSFCAIASEVIGFNYKVTTEITFPFAFKTTSYICIIVRSWTGTCKNYFDVFGSSEGRNDGPFGKYFG